MESAPVEPAPVEPVQPPVEPPAPPPVKGKRKTTGSTIRMRPTAEAQGRRDPVPIMAVDPCSDEQVRLVVPATDWDRIGDLQVPDADEDGTVVWFGGEVEEVLDLDTRDRWLVRLAPCGQPCACGLEAWPADRDDEVPAPGIASGWPLLMSRDEDWEQVEDLLGRSVEDMALAELVAAVGPGWPL